ncbi:MAG: tyrosine-type recombinase/integrase [Proteobacteria bacterium]|nr:tyrosine-type recombinase/integrase [Pseudomonadota bacterium]
MTPSLGQIVQSYFEDYLRIHKGLRPSSIRSYRDCLKLFLIFVAKRKKVPITRLSLADLVYDMVQDFLRHTEEVRGNHARSRNQRLAGLRTFYQYISIRVPEMMGICQRVAAIPIKRSAPVETNYLDHDEMKVLLRSLPSEGRHALRNRALILFLYNTGARVQEVVDLRCENLDLGSRPLVQLHGKGDKWRACPLWEETTKLLRMLVGPDYTQRPTQSVFCSKRNIPITRFGIYKMIRRYAGSLDIKGSNGRRVSPHIFRHTAAVHLLESGVEVNVIRGWLVHVSLETTNRYAEITLRAKEEALRKCEPDFDSSVGFRRQAVWRNDSSLLGWLSSL